MNDSVRILLVDDDPDLADVTSTFLEREDDRFDVDTATDADSGLEVLAERDIDCVVSDYDMPGRNGIEFLEAVRDEYPDLPFILFTGKGSEAVASEAISAGVTDYLQKGGATSQYAVLANRIGNAVEQHRAKRAVTEVERRLSQIADKAEDVLYMFDADWEEPLFVNAAYEDLWGEPIETLREDPHSFLERVHPDDRERVRESMERISNGEEDDIEYRVLRPDGERRFVRAKTKPIFDDDGSVSHVVGFVRDVTEQRLRERELEQAREEYAELINGMNDTAWVIDHDESFLAVNDAAVETVGYSREELLSMEVHDIDAGLEESEVSALIEDMPADEFQVFETAHETKDGEVIPVEISSSLITYHGETAILSVGRDITNRKEREKQLEEFASVVSHDLRNPLTVAQGRLDLLRGDVESEHLEDIAYALDRMEALIEDLLTLAREGSQVGEMEPVDLAALARRCWNQVATAETTLVIDLDRTIRADRSRLRQLLENLIRNSVEHGSTSPPSQAQENSVEHGSTTPPSQAQEDTGRRGTSSEPSVADAPEDSVEHGSTSPVSRAQRDAVEHDSLSQTRARTDENGDTASVTVTVGGLEDGFYVEDDGPGIPESEREDVFETGYSSVENGTGFGLSIVEQVADAHGWDVRLTDSAAGGARFEITGVEPVDRSASA